MKTNTHKTTHCSSSAVVDKRLADAVSLSFVVDKYKTDTVGRPQKKRTLNN